MIPFRRHHKGHPGPPSGPLSLWFDVTAHNTRRGSYSLGAPKRQVRTKTQDPPLRLWRLASAAEGRGSLSPHRMQAANSCHGTGRTAKHGKVALAASGLRICGATFRLSTACASSPGLAGLLAYRGRMTRCAIVNMSQVLSSPSSLISRFSRKRRDPVRTSVPVLFDHAQLDAVVPKRHDLGRLASSERVTCNFSGPDVFVPVFEK